MNSASNDFFAISDWIDKWYPQGVRKIIVPYSYTVTFSAVAAGATQTQQLNITANADFCHLQTAIRGNLAGATQNLANFPIPLARLLITDSGTNEQFTAAPVDVACYATKVVPNDDTLHAYPRIITGRSSLSLVLTSYEAAQAFSLDVVLSGVLVRTYS